MPLGWLGIYVYIMLTFFNTCFSNLGNCAPPKPLPLLPWFSIPVWATLSFRCFWLLWGDQLWDYQVLQSTALLRGGQEDSTGCPLLYCGYVCMCTCVHNNVTMLVQSAWPFQSVRNHTFRPPKSQILGIFSVLLGAYLLVDRPGSTMHLLIWVTISHPTPHPSIIIKEK